jgi:hypothetical protein
MTPSWRRAALALALAQALALCACGDPNSTTSTTGQTAAERVSPDDPADPAPAGDEAPASMPPAGNVRLRIGDDGLTLFANAAPRGPLLKRLARELGFELIASDLGDEPITARLESGRLGDALPRLLPDRAYTVGYRYDPIAARHTIGRLEVARAGALTVSPAAPLSPSSPKAAPLEPAPSPPPAAAPRAELGAETRTVTDAESARARLDDADFEERIAALTLMAPEGKALVLIIDRLANDPEPRVRAAAAGQLEFADNLASVDALVGALDDPDRRVVLSAIDALQLTEDATVIEELRPLLDHEDEEIREAADAAIFMIED